jgi:hypothetical protein
MVFCTAGYLGDYTVRKVFFCDRVLSGVLLKNGGYTEPHNKYVMFLEVMCKNEFSKDKEAK